MNHPAFYHLRDLYNTGGLIDCFSTPKMIDFHLVFTPERLGDRTGVTQIQLTRAAHDFLKEKLSEARGFSVSLSSVPNTQIPSVKLTLRDEAGDHHAFLDALERIGVRYVPLTSRTRRADTR